MLRSIDMHRHMTLGCTLQVITSEYPFYDATLLISICCFTIIVIVQLYQNVAINLWLDGSLSRLVTRVTR